MALHPDIEVGDVARLLEQRQAIWVGDPRSGGEPRHLHLALLLGSLHTSWAGAVARPTTIDRRRRRLCSPGVSPPANTSQDSGDLAGLGT